MSPPRSRSDNNTRPPTTTLKAAKFILRTLKGIYDILATYLLLFIIPFALAGFVFHLGFLALAEALGYASDAALWTAASSTLHVSSSVLRIVLFLPLHYAAFRLLRAPVTRIWPRVEAAFDQLIAAFHWFTERLPGLRVAGSITFTLVVTALLVPFVIQPTLVPEWDDERAWLERTANLLDGTAVATIADSVVGLYRRIYADPVVTEGLPPGELDVFDQTTDGVATGPIVSPRPTGAQPLPVQR